MRHVSVSLPGSMPTAFVKRRAAPAIVPATFVAPRGASHGPRLPALLGLRSEPDVRGVLVHGDGENRGKFQLSEKPVILMKPRSALPNYPGQVNRTSCSICCGWTARRPKRTSAAAVYQCWSCVCSMARCLTSRKAIGLWKLSNVMDTSTLYQEACHGLMVTREAVWQRASEGSSSNSKTTSSTPNWSKGCTTYCRGCNKHRRRLLLLTEMHLHRMAVELATAIKMTKSLGQTHDANDVDHSVSLNVKPKDSGSRGRIPHLHVLGCMACASLTDVSVPRWHFLATVVFLETLHFDTPVRCPCSHCFFFFGCSIVCT